MMEDWKISKPLGRMPGHLTKSSVDLTRLASPRDLASISQVRYAHDPVPKLPRYMKDIPQRFPVEKFEQDASLLQNGVQLFPREAHLPFRCTLGGAFESRYWRASLDASLKMLKLISEDHSASDIEVNSGITLARLATKELRPGIEDRFNRATTYMYPFGSKERIELLAAMMVMQFLFDDKCEQTSDHTLTPFVSDFRARLEKESTQPEDSQLQKHISSVLRGIRAQDRMKGNGGEEVINTMRKAFQRRRPEGEFATVRDYLEFRHDNVGAQFVLASVKFSIGSDVDLSDPRLQRFLTLVKDHLSIVNDLASFDKEDRAFKSGADKEIINIVDVVRQLLSLSDDDAKVLAYTIQLQTEESMRDELDRLISRAELTASHWHYLHALFVSAAGNAFYSMISSRYGGEAARIPVADSKKRKAAIELLSPRTQPGGFGMSWVREESDESHEIWVDRSAVMVAESC